MKTKMKPKNMKCPYCGKTAVLRKASYVYKDRALEECIGNIGILRIILA